MTRQRRYRSGDTTNPIPQPLTGQQVDDYASSSLQSGTPQGSPWPGIDGVWLLPCSYIIHLGEEYFVAGGFPRWAERTLAARFSSTEFVAWNAFAFALMCVGAWLVSRDPKFRFIEIALALAVLGNVVAHLLASLVTWTYSPGLITGILIWLPVGLVRLRSARHASSHKGRTAGTYLGITVAFITVVVLAYGTLLGG